MLREFSKKPFQLQPPSKLIIDTHGGLQDILAIVFAQLYIKKHGTNQEIIGITCVAGKNSVEDAVKSALVANKILGTKIPVYRGQSQSMLLKKEYPKAYAEQKFTHVQKNLYKLLEHDTQIHKLLKHVNAIDFLTNACQQHKNNLGIVAFGPVTNLGLVQRLQSSLCHVKMLSLMGGQCMGMGNTAFGHVQPNFAHDPLAAHLLFELRKNSENLANKIYVNPIEKSLSFCFKQAINMCLDSGKVQTAIEQILISMMGINSIVLNCGPILTILPFLNPKSVKSQYYLYGEIVRDSGTMDGLLAVNWLKVGALAHQFENFFYMYEDYDKDTINEMLLKSFTTA